MKISVHGKLLSSVNRRSLSDWTVSMRAEEGSSCSVSWILLYRASTSGFRAVNFHKACYGMGKCVVVIKAENGRVAVLYNEDGFISVDDRTRPVDIISGRDNYIHGLLSPNLNGFIASVAEDGGCGKIFHRNPLSLRYSIETLFIFGDNDLMTGDGRCDLSISSYCEKGERSLSRLGVSYGEPDVDPNALFGQELFRVCDYEVFKFFEYSARKRNHHSTS
jgi:hypothetical protein